MSSNQVVNPVYSFVKRALVFAVLISLAMTLASFAVGGARLAFSVGVGALMSMASFAVLALVVTRAFGGGRAVFLGFLGLVKMAVIGIVLWWLVSQKVVEPVSFMIGFSAMVAALIVEGLKKK